MGGVLSAIIAFLITAAVVYFVFVLPISAARRLDRKRRGLPEEEETSVSEDIVLLTEIRDALTVQQGGTAQPGGPVQPGGPTPQV